MRIGLWCKPTCLLMYQDKGRGLRLVSPCLKTQKKKPLNPHEDHSNWSGWPVFNLLVMLPRADMCDWSC